MDEQIDDIMGELHRTRDTVQDYISRSLGILMTRSDIGNHIYPGSPVSDSIRTVLDEVDKLRNAINPDGLDMCIRNSLVHLTFLARCPKNWIHDQSIPNPTTDHDDPVCLLRRVLLVMPTLEIVITRYNSYNVATKIRLLYDLLHFVRQCLWVVDDRNHNTTIDEYITRLLQTARPVME